MDKPHPSHPFTEPHPMVYKIAWGNPEKKVRWMRNQCLQDEGVDCSFHRMFIPGGNFIENLGNPLGTFKSHTNALIQCVKFHFISKLVIKRGLELMATTLGYTFQKEEVGI